MKKARRADTNVLCVKFNKLTEPSNVHAGDAVTCANSNCTAVLSFVSKVTTPVADGSDQGNKVRLVTGVIFYECNSCAYFLAHGLILGLGL